MRLLIVGCNHRSAPVEQRELIAFDGDAAARALDQFRQHYPRADAVLLSTCNRTELYVARPLESSPGIREIIAFLATCRGIDVQEISGALYAYEDLEAVRHLFRVTSSLDAMVLGESQILGQVREALERARTANTAGATLGPLFDQALATARDIHTHTGLGSGRISVGSTAVDLARQIFSHFDDKTVLMLGAGEMGELTLKHLLSANPQRVWVTNRTDRRAAELARRLHREHDVSATAIPYGDWVARLHEVDIVICSTAAAEPVLTAEQFADAPKKRKYRPILLIDIAVPRDVDPAVAEQHDCVFLYNIDDLQAVTEANLAQRKEAVGRSEQVIAEAVTAWAEQRAPRDVGPIIEALRSRFRDISRSELERVLPKLENLSPHDRELIEQMLHRVTQKLLHHPVTRLSRTPANGPTQIYADALRALFELQDERE